SARLRHLRPKHPADDGYPSKANGDGRSKDGASRESCCEVDEHWVSARRRSACDLAWTDDQQNYTTIYLWRGVGRTGLPVGGPAAGNWRCPTFTVPDGALEWRGHRYDSAGSFAWSCAQR